MGVSSWVRSAALWLGVALSVVGCRPAVDGDRVDALDGLAVFEDVVKYVEFGEHRTASAGDIATSMWLAEELESAGFEVELQGWTLDQFQLQECSVGVGEREIGCFPFWMPPTLDHAVTAQAVRVTETTGRDQLDGRIVVVDAATVGGGHFKLGVSDEILGSDAVGAVYVVASETGEVVAQNAAPPFDRNPLPIPVVIVGQKDETMMLEAADNRHPVRLSVTGSVVTGAEAFNVVGRLTRGPVWIVVSTPTSGWFSCGGERGPGVALWLALARWTARLQTDTSFLFIATSGHELDYMGAHLFAESAAAPPTDGVVVWLHLGASIGTRLWERSADSWRPLEDRSPGNLVGSPEIVDILETVFTDISGFNPRNGDSKGELRVILENGYRAFGLYGGHQWFHTARDTAESTDAVLLEPIARACAAALVEIEAEFGR